MKSQKPIKRIPDTLLNTENAFFLVGRRFWDENFIEGLELCLQQWVKEGGDYVGLLNYEHDLKLPSMIMRDTPTEIEVFVNDSIWVNGRHNNPIVTVDFRNYPNIPNENIQLPLAPLLYDHTSIVNKYVVYLHHLINMEENTEVNGASLQHMPKLSTTINTGKTSGIYTGLTRQGWSNRYAQHLSAANCGSNYLFHRALRGQTTTGSVHTVYSYDLTFEDAMNLEEEIVEKHSLYPRGLNMIPGGFTGLKYLATHGFKPQCQKGWKRLWENREHMVAKFSAYCSRAGKPNPLAAANWTNDAYAASVIVGHPKNFNLEDVRNIRKLHESGFKAHDIATRMMVNVRRVRTLLRGNTYRRVQ